MEKEDCLSFSNDKELLNNLKNIRKELSDLSNLEHILATSFIVDGIDKEIKKLFSEFDSFVLSIQTVSTNDGYLYLSSNIYPSDCDEVVSSDEINDILAAQFSKDQIEKYTTIDFDVHMDKITYSKDYLKENLLNNLLISEQRKLLNYKQLEKDIRNKEETVLAKKMKV